MEIQSSMYDQFLSKIYKHIEDNLDNEHFSVEDLAQHVGLSRSMLHRKLIKLTGKSASDLITEKRLIKAKELLENNVATASEIAYRVGFNSPSYFNKVFKNYFQISPGDIRKGISPIQVQEIQPLTRKNFSRLSLTALILLLVVVITGAGIYFIFRKDIPVEKSIAILPFDNLSSNDENQHFADGIVEDLLNRISQIDGLKVISRTSSEMFRNKGSKTIPEIGNLLNVRYILEGTVQRQTDRVRINIQLIDAKSDDHILSKQYDRNLSEVFNIQSEIASQIASELSIALNDQQENALMQNQTTNLKAFEYKQLGRYHLNQRSRENLHSSMKYFHKAITEDPDYALAYAELADAYFISSWYDYIDLQIGKDSAEYLALKALEIDKNIGEAHTVLGVIYDQYNWNYPEAEREFRQAIQISPNHATSYQYFAEFLTTAGRLEEAREMMNKAVELDPYSLMTRLINSGLYFQEKKNQQALTEIKICQELSRNNPAAISKELSIHIKSGNDKAALETYKKLGVLTGEWTPEFADSIFHSEGINGLLNYRIRLGNWTYFIVEAHYYTLLGDNDKALDFLERALEEGHLFPENTADFELESLRSEPRFKAIRKKMGLPPL